MKNHLNITLYADRKGLRLKLQIEYILRKLTGWIGSSTIIYTYYDIFVLILLADQNFPNTISIDRTKKRTQYAVHELSQYNMNVLVRYHYLISSTTTAITFSLYSSSLELTEPD